MTDQYQSHFDGITARAAASRRDRFVVGLLLGLILGGGLTLLWTINGSAPRTNEQKIAGQLQSLQQTLASNQAETKQGLASEQAETKRLTHDYGSPRASTSLGRPLVSPDFSGCHGPVDRRQRRARQRGASAAG